MTRGLFTIAHSYISSVILSHSCHYVVSCLEQIKEGFTYGTLFFVCALFDITLIWLVILLSSLDFCEKKLLFWCCIKPTNVLLQHWLQSFIKTIINSCCQISVMLSDIGLEEWPGLDSWLTTLSFVAHLFFSKISVPCSPGGSLFLSQAWFFSY